MNEIIINKLNQLLDNADKLWIKRKRKITTKLLFNVLAQTIIKNKGVKHILI